MAPRASSRQFLNTYVLSAIDKKLMVKLPVLFLQMGKTKPPSSGLFAEEPDSVQLKLFAVNLDKLGQQFQPDFPTLTKMSEMKAVTWAFLHETVQALF